MLTVVFASPKGGCGKTTAALVLALGLYEQGQSVAFLDADPNKPLVRWSELPSKPPGISVQAAPTATDVPDALRDALRSSPDWLICDTEGSTAGFNTIQYLKPDIVITPLGPSPLDAEMAIKAQEMLAQPKLRANRPVLHCALLTRVPALLRPRTLKAAVELLERSGMPLLPTAVVDKEAFRLLFSYGGSFPELEQNDAPGVEAARSNSHDLALVVRSAVMSQRPRVASDHL